MQVVDAPQRSDPGGRTPGLPVVAVAGFVGALLLAIGAWSAGVFPRRGSPESWTAWTPFILPRWAGWATWIAGLVLLSVAWIALHRLAREGRVGVTIGRVALVAVLWAAPLVVAPPVGSRDVYSYAAHGQLVSEGFDPGVAPPWTLGLRSPFRQAVDPLWRGVVSAYGPISSELAAVTVDASDHDVTRSVLGLRAWMVLGVALMGAGVVVLARRSGTMPVDALALAVAGPMTLVHLVGGAHNEALMVGLMVAGLAVAAVRPNLWGMVGGTALIALGAAVKVPALLAVVYLGWRWDGRPVALWVRFARTAGLLGVAAAVLAVVHALTGQSWGWVNGLSAGSNVTSLLSVTTTIALLVRWPLLPLGVARQTTLDAVRLLGQVAGAAIAAVLLWRTPKLGLAGLGGALLVLAGTSASVHPWYFTWSLPVLAVVVAGQRATAFVVGCIALTVTARPDGGGIARNLGFQPLVVLAVALLAAGAWWWRQQRLATTAVSPTASLGGSPGGA